jgi:uncharacterized protein YbjT (DUF2867 family)
MNDQASKPEKPVLIIGGTGKTGRRVAERLTAQGIPVRIGSRTGTPPFDWEDRTTWPQALEGARSAYIAYYPDLAVPGAAENIKLLAKLAQELGVSRLVLLSGRGEEGALQSEQALQQSGADWTVIRVSWFNQNFSESFLLDSIAGGVLALPVGDVTEPFIDAEDIADVAAAALTDDKHIGQLYELTGPRSLMFAEVTEMIAQASGRSIAYMRISTEEFIAGLEQQNLPQDFTNLLIELFTQVLDGRNSSVTDGVRRALGRDPRDFSQYARETAATGIWRQTEAHG